jgi:Leucine-rich repeat (LRR) protein
LKAGKLGWINEKNTNFSLGARSLANSFGINCSRGSGITRVDLGHNSISNEQIVSILKGLSQCIQLKKLNLSQNAIG